MTASGAPDPRGFPAPGSAVPGAPPALKRVLTPADGVPDVAAASLVPRGEPVAAQQISVNYPRDGGPRLVVAAAMLGVAAGLELAGAMAQRRRR